METFDPIPLDPFTTPPSSPFHDSVVLNTRLEANLNNTSAKPTLLRTISAGASPIKHNLLHTLVNLEQTTFQNQRKQVLNDLMLLAGEGVELTTHSSHNQPEFTVSPLRSPIGENTTTQQEKQSSKQSSGRQTNCIASAYDTKSLLSSCHYTDMSFASVPTYNINGSSSSSSSKSNNHRSNRSSSSSYTNNETEEFGGLIYWVNERKGTLGVLDLNKNIKRTLLHGLKRPTHIQTVGNRVYWLESGSDWSFNGRVSFLDRTTERVHVLLSGLHYPRGFHVTAEEEENVYFIEVHRVADPSTVDTWKVQWHINCLPGIHARNAVAGANFGLARLKKTVGILDNPRKLADSIVLHESSSIETLEAGTEEHVGMVHGEEVEEIEMTFAFPSDIVVIGTGKAAMLMIGVALYGVDTRTSMDVFDNQGQTLLSGSDGGEHVKELGGSILWMDIPSLNTSRNSKNNSTTQSIQPVQILVEEEEEEEEEEFDERDRNATNQRRRKRQRQQQRNNSVKSGTVCVVSMLIHRMERIRHQPISDTMKRDVLASILLTNQFGTVNNGDRPYPRNREDNDDYLLKYGCGLAIVHVPKQLSFDGTFKMFKV